MKKLKIRMHWSFIILCILMLIFGKIYVFICAFLTILLHEMGHSFVARKLGYKLDMITLLPYGAMLSGKNLPFSTKDEIKIAIAGPVINTLLLIGNIVLWWIFPKTFPIANPFFYSNLCTLFFNLLPVFPLDGGRIMIALLSTKMARIKAESRTKFIGYVITAVFFLLFFVSFFFQLNYTLGINALFMLIGLLGEDSSSYYEKVTTFEKIGKATEKNRIIALDKTDTLFSAYRAISRKRASKIILCENGIEIKTISKNKILSAILAYPINTQLCKLIE